MMWIKVLFMHFVNSVRWHKTILMKVTRLNEYIDRAVRGAFDIRHGGQNTWRNRSFNETV